ncbi:MAG TPA: hypothetical protein VN380_16610 [Thermoanaerobaculia bacterium]|jgi:hypothetical protein|nr:hypothetical protein [Thermoanaerobaculia bacterium]
MDTPVDTNTPGTPSPTPEKLTPEAVIEQIRTLRSQIGDVTPLSKEQRTQLKRRASKQPAPVVDASISVISSSDMVAQAVGQPLVDVLQLQSVSVRWSLAADEIRSLLKGIEGANLVRREQLAFIASQAYSFGSQLVRNPANADLVPQVEEVKRLKVLTRRKKAAQVPQAPAPSPAPAPVPVTSTEPKA